MEILLLIIGVIIGSLLLYLFLRPKLIKTQLDTNKLIEEIKQKEIIKKELTNKVENLKTDFYEKNLVFQDQLNRLQEEILVLETNKTNLKNTINEMQAEAAKSTEEIYNANYKLMQERLEKSAETLSKSYETIKDKCIHEYLLALEECNEDFAKQFAELHTRLSQAKQELTDYRAKADAAIQKKKKKEEKLLQLDKYKLNLNELDILEINRLREIAPYFRNARPIYKIIWESYFRNNTSELVNRLIGPTTCSGIYKITNLLNQKIYIGQAVDVGTRFKDHIKAGLGIDMPNNKLYMAMFKDGVENFSFELLEKCDKNELNEREIYWIDFYRSQEHGYNMTKGGSAKK